MNKLLLGNLRTNHERVILPSSQSKIKKKIPSLLTNQHSVILPSMLLGNETRLLPGTPFVMLFIPAEEKNLSIRTQFEKTFWPSSDPAKINGLYIIGIKINEFVVLKWFLTVLALCFILRDY